MASFILVFPAYALEKLPLEEGTVIVIDPGHGGPDQGAVGPGGLTEKEITLDMAKRLKRNLVAESPDLIVLLTRNEDKFISFQERTGLANSKGADLFISLHANASSIQDVEGFEIWHLVTPIGEIAGTDDYTWAILQDLKRQGTIEESIELADIIRQNLKETLRDRGVKRGILLPLGDLRMTALLIEMGFITNPLEEYKLKKKPLKRR